MGVLCKAVRSAGARAIAQRESCLRRARGLGFRGNGCVLEAELAKELV
jgi:hypothetical protein